MATIIELAHIEDVHLGAIVSINILFVVAVFLFNQICSTAFLGLQKLSFNCRPICISRLQLIFGNEITTSFYNCFFFKLGYSIFSSEQLKKYVINLNNQICFDKEYFMTPELLNVHQKYIHCTIQKNKTFLNIQNV